MTNPIIEQSEFYNCDRCEDLIPADVECGCEVVYGDEYDLDECEDDGQPTEYDDLWQDVYGGDDYDQGVPLLGDPVERFLGQFDSPEDW